MRRRIVLAGAAWTAAACSQALGLRPSYGIVVEYNTLPGAAKKDSVEAVSDTGHRLFTPKSMRQRSVLDRGGGGVNGYGGEDLPQWVRVTWRAGQTEMNLRAGPAWLGGTIVGDYRVEVASRIPKDTLAYASGSDRALKLTFWLHDDGVLLAWDVQEADRGQWRFSHHGGDFVEPFVYNGKLVEPGWYLAPDGRKVIIDR